MSKLITVIMAGGRGERLWPKSSSEMPKQFSKIIGDKTMLEETISRCQLISSPEEIFISTLKDNLPLLKKIIPDFPSRNIILEPIIRDTACAILLSVLLVPADDEDVLVFIPADHYLKHVHKFKNDILTAFRNTQKTGKVTLIGITPNFPSTEYGYLKVKGLAGGKQMAAGNKPGAAKQPTRKKIFTVEKFIEKPNQNKARAYLRTGQYLWNSGIFMFNRKYLLNLFQQHTPELFENLTRFLHLQKNGKTRAALKVFEGIKKISFDYAIAEKISQISCVCSTFFWDDVGSWESLFRIKPTDNQGNIVLPRENCFLKDSEDNLCVIEDDRLVVLNGVKELIVISKDDKIYIAHRKSAGNIKSIIKELENEKSKRFKKI